MECVERVKRKEVGKMKDKVCEVCVMDTTDPDIKFYGKRGCSNCSNAKKTYLKVKKESRDLRGLVKKIRRDGANKKYDCIIGVSGGVDSSYVAYVVKKLHLRPLAVHLDNGWDSKQAVLNVKKVLDQLGIDLYNYVIDWEEFRDIQMSFLKASTPDCEIPTDHAIVAILYKMALKHHVKYIIDGWNIETECILPQKWSYGHADWKYIKSIQSQFGTKRIKTLPHYGRFQRIFYEKIAQIERVHILNYVPYNKAWVKEKLKKEFGWNDYGAKHDESFYTKFYQNYILPDKFGIDKRKMHLSSMIVSGQISRQEALSELEKPLYTQEAAIEDHQYFYEKMGISETEYQRIMEKPKRSYWDYPNYENDFIHKVFGL